MSCMDLLSSTGLINYFGKQTNLQELKIPPILLQKGSNKIALYGLSHIRDERLQRLFKDRKVLMYRPQEDVDKWFNIFVCHQNRVKRPGTKHLSENVIPPFMNLTIWGHEHECLIDPVPRVQYDSTGNVTYISQPGNRTNSLFLLLSRLKLMEIKFIIISTIFFILLLGSTVATSMCEGESGSKYVGLLLINGSHFKMEPLELKTVRLMHFETIKLSECVEDVSNSKKVQKYVRKKIEEILLNLSHKHSGMFCIFFTYL